MSVALTPLPIRLFCDLATPAVLQDLNRGGQPPQFYRGDDIVIDIGLGENGALLTPLAGSGAGGIASVTCQLFATEYDTNAPMMSGTVLEAAMNLALTQLEWTNDTTPFCHAAFVFTNAQTAVPLNGASSQSYWLRITALTTDATAKTITLADGPIMVRDGPASAPTISLTGPAFGLMNIGGQTVPVLLDTTTGIYHQLCLLNDAGTLTLQISDAGYAGPVIAMQFPTGSLFRAFTVGGQIVPQILDTTTGLYHTFAILNDSGVLTLQLSDIGY